MKFTPALLLFLLFTALPVHAQVISLEAVSATKVGDTLAASFGVSLTGAEEIAETLRNGVPLRLTCKASIERQRRYFFNKSLGTAGLEAKLNYEALSKEYVLNLPGPGPLLRNTDLAVLLTEGWQHFSIPLCSWDDLERGGNYRLEIEAALMPVDVPDWFTRTFLFWSWQGGPSVTSTLEFRY